MGLAAKKLRMTKPAAGGGGPLFEDDFTGTNGDPWNAGLWASSATNGGTFTIQGNQGRLSLVGSGYKTGVFLADMTSTADVDAVVTMTPDSAANERYMTIGVRSTGALTGAWSANCYRAYLSYNLVTRLVAVEKVVSGSRTTFASTTSSWTAAPWKVRIQVEGTAIRVRHWLASGGEPGTWDINTTDPDVTGAGGVFLGMEGGNTNLTRIVDFDDITVEAL